MKLREILPIFTNLAKVNLQKSDRYRFPTTSKRRYTISCRPKY